MGDHLKRMSVVGVVERVEWGGKKEANPKETEVEVYVRQEVFGKKFESVGVCKVLVRYETFHHPQALAFLEPNWLYAFNIREIVLTDRL